MKFLPYILRNVMRNKLRSVFTGLSIAVSLFLVTVMYAYVNMQDEMAIESMKYARVVVTAKQGLTFPVPDRARRQGAVDGRSENRRAAGLVWRQIQGRQDPFRAVRHRSAARLRGLFRIHRAAEQLSAWQKDRTGCVVGEKIARKRGWKVGDRIVLKGDIYPVNLELTIDGIYTGPAGSDTGDAVVPLHVSRRIAQASPLAVGRQRGHDVRQGAIARAMPELMRAIDGSFANSESPVRAMTEQAFRQMFTEMLGNVRAYIRNVALAVVISLMCVAGNAMAMSLRERTREVAVLKAIGFSRFIVLTLVLVEAVIIAVGGGMVGVMTARLLFSFSDLTLSGIPGFNAFYVPWSTVVYRPVSWRPRSAWPAASCPACGAAAKSRSSTVSQAWFNWTQSWCPSNTTCRSLRARWVSSLMTVLGTGLVVWASVLAFGLADGLDHTLEVSGEPLDLIVMRKGPRPKPTASSTNRPREMADTRRHRRRCGRRKALLARVGRGRQHGAARRQRAAAT